MSYTVNLKKFIFFILIPLFGGVLSSVISGNTGVKYSLLSKPAGALPYFLIVFLTTITYIITGIAAYIIHCGKINIYKKNDIIKLWSITLILSFIWQPVFYRAGFFIIGTLFLLAAFISSFLCMVKFRLQNKNAGNMMLVYMTWTGILLYISVGIMFLN